MIANILISTSLQDMFANKLKQHIPENIRKQTGSLLGMRQFCRQIFWQNRKAKAKSKMLEK